MVRWHSLSEICRSPASAEEDVDAPAPPVGSEEAAPPPGVAADPALEPGVPGVRLEAPADEPAVAEGGWPRLSKSPVPARRPAIHAHD